MTHRIFCAEDETCVCVAVLTEALAKARIKIPSLCNASSCGGWKIPINVLSEQSRTAEKK